MMNDKYGFSGSALVQGLGLSQDELIAGGVQLARELRAIKAARAEEARARLAGLLQLQVNLEAQIREARQARDNAERDAKE
jgi:multidrug resistance efflux pump